MLHIFNTFFKVQTHSIQDASTKQQKCLLWRRTTVQHYNTTNGDGIYQPDNKEKRMCNHITQWYHPSDQVFAKARIRYIDGGQFAIPVIDMTSIMRDAHNFHSKMNGIVPIIVTVIFLYQPMIYLIAEAILLAC